MKTNKKFLVAILILILFLSQTQTSLAYTYTAEQKSALRRLNYWRKALGLKPAKLDPALSKAATAHSKYVTINAGNPDAFPGWPHWSAWHKEKKGYLGFTGKTPYERAVYFGYSPHGDNGELYIENEVMTLAGLHASVNIDGLMNTLYHMHPLTYYGLEYIGYGEAGNRGLISTIDTAENVYAKKPDNFFRLPFPGQMDVSTIFGGEQPDPVDSIGIKDSTYGPAIVFHHNDIYYDDKDEENPTGSKLVVKSATLTEGGKTVPVYYWNPVRRNLPFKDQIVMFPKDMLKYATKYTVKISGTLKGKAFSEKYNFYTPHYNMTSDLTTTSPIATSIKISKAGWPKRSDNIVLVPVEKHTQAPLAAPLAKKLEAPILTTYTDKLPNETLLEIKRLKPKNITVVGSALEKINSTLKKKGYATNYIDKAGPYNLSKEIAKKVGTNTSREAFMVRKGYTKHALAA